MPKSTDMKVFLATHPGCAAGTGDSDDLSARTLRPRCIGAGVLGERGARLLLGIVLLMSGVAHLNNPYSFLSSLYTYELVGPWSGQLAAMVIMMIECTIATCLLGGIAVGGAFIAAMGLMVVFTIAQIAAISKGLQIGCGCFGAEDNSAVGLWTLGRSVVLLLAALAGLACVGHRYQVEGGADRPADLT